MTCFIAIFTFFLWSGTVSGGMIVTQFVNVTQGKEGANPPAETKNPQL